MHAEINIYWLTFTPTRIIKKYRLWSFCNWLIIYKYFLLQIPGTCQAPGKCQNVMGSFICTCPLGYRLNERGQCEDIDECYENRDICESGQCTNTKGGFQCTCPPGFVLSQSGMKCEDFREDECYDGWYSNICSAPRRKDLTMKQCCCSQGAAWGRTCSKCPDYGTGTYLTNTSF